jgi:hypothetical protein
VEILQVANGIFFSTPGRPRQGSEDYEAASAAQLSRFHTEYQRTVDALIPGAPPHLLHFASEACGDWLAFNLDTLTETGDCRILKFDHETQTVVREWQSIAHLLDEALDMAESPEPNQ